MFIQELQEFGLSEKEAKVYLALLELEVATVQEVARSAEVNRSSTYVVLESLKRRGLVSISGGKAVQKFVAAPPDRLVRIAEQEAKEKLNIRHKINAILPDLKSLYSGTKQKPVIRIFEGKENIMTHFEESLKMKDKFQRVYASGRAPHKFFHTYLPYYFAKKQELGIVTYGIHPDESSSRELAKHQPPNDKSVFVDPEKYTFSSDFTVYDSTVAYFSHKGEYIISIENSEIADAMKSAFDLAFEGARLADKKARNNSRQRVNRR